MAITVKQHDVNLENKILCLMFQSENIIDVVLESNIEVKDFTFETNRSIFEELIDIYSDFDLGGIAIGNDTNLLYERLVTGERETDKATLLHINKIRNAKVEARHINVYIKQLKDLSKIRGVIQASRNVTNYLKDNENVDADELSRIYDESYQNVYSDVIDTVKAETMEDAVKSTIKELIEDSSKEATIKFNLGDIDSCAKILDGYLTYIVGDTGVGKTTVGTYLASACAKNKMKVLYINLETKNQDCVKKLISSNVVVDNHRIKYLHLINPTLLNSKDWDVLEDIAVNDRLKEMGIYWIHRPGMTDKELQREIIKHVRMYDIDVVIGDYYQLLVKEGFEDMPDSIAIPKISKSLMQMAGKQYINPQGKRKIISHVWLSQCNKEIIYREDKRPTKDDLYFGGTRDARLVLGIYRDEYYNPDTKKPGTIELGVLKQNNGLVNFWFDYIFESQYQIIREMSDDEREQLEANIDEDEE